MNTVTFSDPNTVRRITWIDIFKGINIICIVLGHTSSFWSPFVYLFHVPAFFFISGYNSKYQSDTGAFLIRKIKTLLLPYFVINIVFLLLHLVSVKLGIGRLFFGSSEFIFVQAFNNLLNIVSTDPLGGATWFLIVLFEGQILLHFILKTIHDKPRANLIIILCSITALCISYLLLRLNIRLSYLLDLSFIGLFYIAWGYLAKLVLLPILVRKFSAGIRYLWIPSLILLMTIAINYWVPIDFPSRSFGPLPQIVIYSSLGFTFLLSLSLFLENSLVSSTLTKIGQNSLWIMCLHFFGFKLVSGMLYVMGIVSPQQIISLVPDIQYGHLWPIYAIGGVLIPLLFYELYLKVLHRYKIIKITPSEVINIIVRMKWSIIVFFILALWTGINMGWILSASNFYYADDFGHMYTWRKQDIFSFFTLLPKQVYNDRPVGQIFFKLLFEILGYRYRVQHGIIFGLHIINGLLLFKLALRLLRHSSKYIRIGISGLTACMFLVWTQSTFAVQWISAAFDLLAGFWVLSYLMLYFSPELRRRRYLWIFTLSLLTIVMARTKEATLFTPFIAVVIDFIILRDKDGTWQSWRQKLIDIFSEGRYIPLCIASFYIAYLKYMQFQDNMGFQIEGHPYLSSIKPEILLINFVRYVYLFFNINQNGQVFTQFQPVGLTISLVLLTIFVFLPFFQHKTTTKLSGVGYLLTIFLGLLPVLPLVNMQHKLYLYIPSIFIFLAAGNALVSLFHDNVLGKLKVSLFITCILSMFFLFNRNSPVHRSEIRWWKDVGEENRAVFLTMQSLTIPREIRKIHIINIDKPTSIFQFGDGVVLRVLYNRDDIMTDLYEKDSPPRPNVLNEKFSITYDYEYLKRGLAK